MASADQYAEWIVKNKNLKGTEKFNTVLKAYKEAKELESKTQERPEINKVAEGARKFAQGATFGFSDEAEAAARAAASANKNFGMLGLGAGLQDKTKPIKKGDIFDQMGLRTQEVSEDFVDYRTQKNKLSAQAKEFERQNPYLAGALEMAGGFLTPAMALKGATTAGTIGKNILGGAATGALSGVGRAEDSSDLLNDAARSALFGAGVGGALSGVGSFIAPKLSKEARSLQSQGVNLTPGQAFGGQVATAEQAINKFIPNVTTRRQENVLKWNENLLNKVLKPIGKKIKIGDDVQEGVGKARQAVSNAYEGLLPKLTLKSNASLKKQFNAVLNDKQFKGMSKQLQKEFKDEAQEILKRLGPKGQTGQALKDVQTDLTTRLGDFKMASGSQATYGRALGKLKEQFDDAIIKQNPTYKDSLAKINSAFKNLTRVEGASAKMLADATSFTPKQLYQAVRQKDFTKGKSATAGGRALFQKEAKEASILGDTLPTSGTSERLFAGAGLLGGGSMLGLSAKTLALPAATYLLYTKPGQKIFNAWIKQRSRSTEDIANFIKNYSIPAASGLLTQFE